MHDLMSSRVRVSRMARSSVDGRPAYSWVLVPGLESVPCRLDLAFVRPGKDTPPTQEAGKALDRTGTGFFPLGYGDQLRPGDRLTTVRHGGRQPVVGTFSIQAYPDPVQDLGDTHHYECQVVEVAQLVVV